MFFDNCPETQEHIIATDACLQKLGNPEEWFSDDNFTMASTLFQQLYVICIKNHGVFVTVVYWLLHEKKHNLQMNIIIIIILHLSTLIQYILLHLSTLTQTFLDLNVVLDPLSLYVDFKLSIIRTAKHD